MAKQALLERISSSDLAKKQYVLTLPRLVWLLCQEALRRAQVSGQDDQRTLNSTGVRRLEDYAKKEGFRVSRTPLMNILGPYRRTMDGELSPVRPPLNPQSKTLAAIAHMSQIWDVRDPEDPDNNRLIFKSPGDLLNLHRSTYHVWIESIQQEGEKQPVLLSPQIREIAMLMESLEESGLEEVRRQVMNLMPGKQLSLVDRILKLSEEEQRGLAAKVLGNMYSMLPNLKLRKFEELPDAPMEAIAALKKKQLPPKPIMQIFVDWCKEYSTETFHALELSVNPSEGKEVSRRVVDIVASAMSGDGLNPRNAEDVSKFLAHGPDLDELENSVVTCILTGVEIPQDAYSAIADALAAYGIETTAEKLTAMSEDVSHV